MSRFVESDSGHWLSFLNFQDFRVNLWDPEKRLNIQPSFVLAGLAMASLMKSSQLEYGVKGRERAIWFRNRAYECLHAALSSEWREDATLAGAALVCSLLILYLIDQIYKFAPRFSSSTNLPPTPSTVPTTSSHHSLHLMTSSTTWDFFTTMPTHQMLRTSLVHLSPSSNPLVQTMCSKTSSACVFLPIR